MSNVAMRRIPAKQSLTHKANSPPMKLMQRIFAFIIFGLLFSACSPAMQPTMILPTSAMEEDAEQFLEITPYPTRPAYAPGEWVEYLAQAGDTLPALAARFNTTIEEIKNANPSIPQDATTMPPGMPMQIPIYYRALWGTPFQILPDAAFVNGPDASGFDAQGLIDQQGGWVSSYRAWAFDGNRTVAEIVDHVAINYSISPKFLLALLEYQGGCFSRSVLDPLDEVNILGLDSDYWRGVYLQLSYASNILNDGYYRWREGDLLEFDLADGTLIRPDPWQNAATVALQYFFSQTLSPEAFHYAIGPDGFSKTYQTYFGDPWTISAHLPGSLSQPEMQLPYEIKNNSKWAYTGGPHTAWGSLAPWAALDFAPPTGMTGCFISSVPTTAVADGLVVRDGEGLLLLDLDGDGDERTGWVILYLHISDEGRVPVGTQVSTGDFLGYPSCEGGNATGTHIHIARKYNGEWMSADSVVPFVLSGWRPIRGDEPYAGYLEKQDWMIVANTNPDNLSIIPTDEE